MIKINLLPEELRRTTGTPPLLLGVIFGGIALTAITACLYVYFWFNLHIVEGKYNRLHQEVGQLEKQAKFVDSLQEDIQNYKQREKTIVEMKTTRRLWSLKLDQLVQLTPPEIWITELELKQNEKADKKEESGYLQLDCYALGANVEIMSNFRQALMGSTTKSKLWRDFLDPEIAPNDFSYGFSKISKPSWKKVLLDNFSQKENIRFSIQLSLENTEASDEEEA